MAVHISLRRIGKNPKGKPHFRVTVFDERMGRDSRIIEELGYYKPTTGVAVLKKERIILFYGIRWINIVAKDCLFWNNFGYL